MVKGKKVRIKVKNPVKNNHRNFYVVLLFGFALIIFLAYLIIDFSNVLEEKEIDIKLRVAETSAFKVGNDSLDFGRIGARSSAQKTLIIENNYKFPIVVYFNATGNVSDFLIFEPSVYFEPEEKKDIVIATIVFSDEPYGNYTGIMKVVFSKV